MLFPTDRVVEEQLPGGGQFGEERLRAFVRHTTGPEPAGAEHDRAVAG